MQLKTRFWPFIAIAAITFTACKKSATISNTTTDAANTIELSIHSGDQLQVSNETDAVANDANAAIESNATFSGRMEGVTSLICDAAITADDAQKKITITYNGNNCPGTRTRTGVVTIALTSGNYWRSEGAVLTITYQNLKITKLADNKSITINGSQTITNVSGGRLIDLPTRGSITHTINSSNMSITFDDGTQRTWQIAKKRVFTYSNGIVITTTGTHTEGSSNNISEWGTNRFGHSFTTSITQPLVVRQDCNLRLTSGQVQHSTSALTATATFGLDASGNATSCPGTGNYFFKLVWTG